MQTTKNLNVLLIFLLLIKCYAACFLLKMLCTEIIIYGLLQFQLEVQSYGVTSFQTHENFSILLTKYIIRYMTSIYLSISLPFKCVLERSLITLKGKMISK